MSDETQREYAGWLTDEAKRIITTERANTHGGAEDSFRMIAQMWTIYIINANAMRHYNQPESLFLDEQDVAEMMSLMKKCRKVHGQQGSVDNYVDDIGYVALGGAMAIAAGRGGFAAAGPVPEEAAGQVHEWETDLPSVVYPTAGKYASFDEGPRSFYHMNRDEYEEWQKLKNMQVASSHTLASLLGQK